MPLVATLSEQRMEANCLDDQAWESMRKRYRAGEPLLMPCGQPGVPRRSKLGLKHFAHKAGEKKCTLHWDESPEHLELKAILAQAARDRGWEAVLEYPAHDRSWIADVMATDGRRSIALEVQWSPQSAEDFVRRQQRYAEAGLECIWFVSPRNREHASDVPSVELKGGSGTWAVCLTTGFGRSQDVPLAEAAADLLNGDYRELIEPYVQAYSVQVAMMKCWKESCSRWLTVWRLDDIQVKTRCGLEGTVETTYDPLSRLFQKERIEALVAAQVLPLLGHAQVDLPRPATLASRYSKTADRTYLAYCCPHCGAMQGDVPINESKTRWRTYVIGRPLRLPIDTTARMLQHLCVDRGRGQCSQQSTSAGAPAFPGAHFSIRFYPELLTDDLDRLPRRGEPRRSEPRQIKNESFAFTSLQLNEALKKGLIGPPT